MKRYCTLRERTHYIFLVITFLLNEKGTSNLFRSIWWDIAWKRRYTHDFLDIVEKKIYQLIQDFKNRKEKINE